MSHLHLLIPALLQPAPAALLPAAPPRLPAFALLFGRGEHRIEPGMATEHWIAPRFGAMPDAWLPLAALALLGSGGNPGTGAWLRADPVHLHPHGTTLTLVRSHDTALTPADAAALCAALNDLFAGDGLRFSSLPDTPDDWYVALDRPPALRTTPVTAVRGLGIDPWLPSGPDASAWQTRMTETQMILHTHPVNAAREAAGLLPVNSLWIWGEGALGVPLPSPSPYAAVFADEASTRGLALHAGAAAARVPRDLAAVLERIDAGNILVRLDAVADAKALGDTDTAQALLRHIDTAWIEPALAALRRGRLTEVTVSAIDRHRTVSVTTTRAGLRRFWRRPLSLETVAARGSPDA